MEPTETQARIELNISKVADETQDTIAFNERSDIVEEIISRKPDFFEKWALIIFLLTLVVVAAGTWFIKYPDIIEGQVVLTGENTPKEIIARQSGKLVRFSAHNNQSVKEGDILGWIESSADVTEVIGLSGKLNEFLKTMNHNDANVIPHLFMDTYSHLGELQGPYQNLSSAWRQYNDYQINGFFVNRRNMLQTDILGLRDVIAHTTLQKQLIEKDNGISRKSYEMSESLYKEKVISAEEFRQAQSKMLNNEKAIPQIDIDIAYKENQIRDKQKEIDQLNHDIAQQQKIFEEALFTFKSTLDDWLRKFTIKAPADGQVVLILPLQPNQYIEQGKLLGYVNPASTRYYAEVRMGQQNFGKVSAGMKVQIRLDAYPYQELGFLNGKLNYISKVAIDSGFLGTVELEKGLVTNMSKPIQFKSGLKGRALIITKDIRLLDRIYYSIIKTSSLNN